MKDEIISFETSKLIEEKGFKEPCYYYYTNDKKLHEPYLENGSSTDIDFRVDLEDLLESYYFTKNVYAAPTQSLLQKWLREKYNTIVEILIFDKGFLEKDKFCYQWRVYPNTEDWFTGLEFKTYEEALEEGLQEALKII